MSFVIIEPPQPSLSRLHRRTANLNDVGNCCDDQLGA